LTFDQIINGIQNKIYASVYFFHGEEPFFTDQLTAYLEANILDEGVREFNQTIVYGRDVTARQISDLARRFPMMGNYQVVVVKEAQDMQSMDGLESYFENPLNSTVLVMSYKHKKLDKRKTFYKKLKQNKDVVLFESVRIRDYEIPRWIEKEVGLMGYKIHPIAAELLSDHLGNDLGKINNELGKLVINIEQGTEITQVEIEENIGISKDFNIFELQNALTTRNALKAQRIVQYFEANPKEHPLQMVSVMLHNFFIKVYICHHIKNKEDRQIAAELGVNPFFVKDYKKATKIYPPQKVKSIISRIRDLDLKSKGVGSMDAGNYGGLKELVFRIIN